MARLTWSPQALQDLDEICDHIARESPAASRAFAQRVRTAVARLADFPQLGRVVPEYGRDTIREIIVGRYRIIYRYNPAAVEITTVLSGARLLTGKEPRGGE